MRIENKDLTEGNISKNIFSFCIPLIIGSLVQMLFNMADQVVLGQMAGGVAVASVGACSTIVHLIVNFFVGLGGGVSIILARSIGMKNEAASKNIISTAMISSVGIGIFATLVALPCINPLLHLTECPADCFDGAFTYTFIYYLSIPAITIYNFGASILRVSGDSRRPTIYLILAGALNLVMNVILCFIMTNKVAAVALATTASQILGAVLTTRRLVLMSESYRLDLKKLTFKWGIFGKMLRYGVPIGINSSLYSIANLQIQAAINSFGVDAIAGHSAAKSLDDGIVGVVSSSFATTVTTMVGQNLGAGKRERVEKTIFFNALYSITITSALAVLIYILRVPLIKLYVPDKPGAIGYGVIRMQHVLLWYGVHAYFNVMLSTLNAFGYSMFSMISNIGSTVVFRTIWMQFVYPKFGTFEMVMSCFTVAWLISAFIYTIAFSIVFIRYKHGKIRKI